MPADEPDLVSEEEVRLIIHSLPLKKAAGPDHITNEHLKFGGSVLPAILSSLFNAIVISGHIPAPCLGAQIQSPASSCALKAHRYCSDSQSQALSGTCI